MKQSIMMEFVVDITHVKVSLPVWYGDEDMPNDFPMRSGERWSAFINVDTGSIANWPIGKSGNFHMKVCDSGVYTLYSENREVKKLQDYVPHGLIPGEYGDYVAFIIDENGVITNWPKSPDLSGFFINGGAK